MMIDLFTPININNPFSKSLLNTLFISKKSNIDYFLFENVDYKNLEHILTTTVLTPGWTYTYFIPGKTHAQNIFLIGFLNKIPQSIYTIFKKKTNNPIIIINLFIQYYNITPELYNHSVKWANQILFADLLDHFFSGSIFELPPHWGQPENIHIHIDSSTLPPFNATLNDYLLTLNTKKL